MTFGCAVDEVVYSAQKIWKGNAKSGKYLLDSGRNAQSWDCRSCEWRGKIKECGVRIGGNFGSWISELKVVRWQLSVESRRFGMETCGWDIGAVRTLAPIKRNVWWTQGQTRTEKWKRSAPLKERLIRSGPAKTVGTCAHLRAIVEKFEVLWTRAAGRGELGRSSVGAWQNRLPGPSEMSHTDGHFRLEAGKNHVQRCAHLREIVGKIDH